jgi:hypothetical protein
MCRSKWANRIERNKKAGWRGHPAEQTLRNTKGEGGLPQRDFRSDLREFD